MAQEREQNPWFFFSDTGALQAANQVDDWIAIDADGTVNIFSGKVELGTGVQTALAQIAVEELDVPLERVRMVMGDTARSPNQGHTAGSKTIQYGGVALRHAAAEARQALLEMATDRLDAAPDELVVREGVVSVRDHPDRTVTYAELIGGKRFDRAVSRKAPLKRPEEYQIVGRPIPRFDIPRKVTAQPSYVHDVRIPGMQHGRVVRLPSPGTRLVSVDESSVKEARVVRLGSFVGVVAAREEEAIRAAQALKLQWRETARLPAMEHLHDGLRRRHATEQVVAKHGRLPGAWRRAVTRLHATYYQPYQAHASIGPSCAVADYRDGQVVVWSNTQGPFALRGALADLLELPTAKVRVIHVEGAGSYGHSGADDAAADAALLARAVGQPVRVQWSREDEFAWEPKAPAMVMDLQGGLNKKGNVIAWEYNCWTPAHGARPAAAVDFLAGQAMSRKSPPEADYYGGGDRNAPTNYRFPNHRLTMHWLASTPLRTSSMRSLGGAPNTFANESFMDELAAAAHADPLEFRLRHLDDQRAIEVLKAAAERAHWGVPLPAGEGRGLAFMQYENEGAYVATVAHVLVDEGTGIVRVRRVVVAHDCGLIINPDGLRNQIEGNVIQSLSRALKEQVTFDERHITSLTWETYPILKFSEVPPIDIVLVNRPDQLPVGAGEPSTTTTAAAVANAIYIATGARLRQVPFTAARVKASVGA